MTGFNINKDIKNKGAVYTTEILSKYCSEILLNLKKELLKEEYKNIQQENYNKTQQEFILENLKNLKIVDPACGDGELLIAFEKARSKEIKILENAVPNFNEQISFINTTTYGVDIDKLALQSAKIKLNRIVRNNINLKWADSLIPVKNKSRLDGWKEMFNDVFFQGGFDAIIANPPWGAECQFSKDTLLEAGYNLLEGQFDIYNLFIELSVELCKPNAPMLFIIPDSIFGLDHTRLRRFLLENTEIKFISRIGEKFFDDVCRACSIIVVVKKVPIIDYRIKCFRLSYDLRDKILKGEESLKNAEEKCMHYVLASRFKNNSNYEFDIDLKDTEIDIIKKIEKNTINLGRLCESGRGVEIAKDGALIKCPDCGNYQSIPKKNIVICKDCGSKFENLDIYKYVAIHKNNNDNRVPLVVGESLDRYGYNIDRFLELNLKGIKYKESSIYSKDKILIRKTGIGITASMDYESCYFPQTVYYYYLKEEIDSNLYPLEYILAILNSRIMFYYLTTKTGEIEWKSHAYITQNTINNLPIRIINSEDKSNKIIVDAIVKLVKLGIKEEKFPIEIDIKIEYLICTLLGLTEDEMNFIVEKINSMQNLQAINRMKVQVDDLQNYIVDKGFKHLA